MEGIDTTQAQLNCLGEIWAPVLEVTLVHPSFNTEFVYTFQSIFYGDGNLTVPYRHYIALMAAARHRCQFLIDAHSHDFLEHGGNKEWLKGISHVNDQKLKMLDDHLNKTLAHQPWLCNAQVIWNMVHTIDPRWSLQDLVLACVILSHTHSLASLIHAVGTRVPASVTIESLRASRSSRDKENEGCSEVEELLKKMADLKADQAISPNNVAQFQALAEGSSDLGSGGESPDRSCDSPIFSEELSFAYVDFANRTDQTRTFKSHEFTWDTGFSILEAFDAKVAEALDDKFKVAQSMTYLFMATYEGVDTTGYRTAIWNYIQALFGIRHDDYDYSIVNKLLSRDMKKFVKTVACFPHKLDEELRRSVMTEFKESEKIHVMIIIMEARLQASMLWFTRCITNYDVLNHKLIRPLD